MGLGLRVFVCRNHRVATHCCFRLWPNFLLSTLSIYLLWRLAERLPSTLLFLSPFSLRPSAGGSDRGPRRAAAAGGGGVRRCPPELAACRERARGGAGAGRRGRGGQPPLAAAGRPPDRCGGGAERPGSLLPLRPPLEGVRCHLHLARLGAGPPPRQPPRPPPALLLCRRRRPAGVGARGPG